MADAVTSQTLSDGGRVAVLKFTNRSDGTGEADVKKIDASTLGADPATGKACTGVSIERVWFTTYGMAVDIEWDATADVIAWHIPQDDNGYLDFRSFGGIQNNAGAGKTGDILFTTVGHTLNDVYSIVLEVAKNY